MKYQKKGKLVYMSLKNCRELRVIGRKFPDKHTGKVLSYNRSVELILKIIAPGFIMADMVKNKILSMEEKEESK